MPSIQIKNVPMEVHESLRRKAAASGQSLQEFLQAELRKIADRTTMAEVFERAAKEGIPLTLDEVREAVKSERKRY